MKCSRRIRPIVSTVSIPPPLAWNQSEQRIRPTCWGSILDADPPAQGVKIACRMTVGHLAHDAFNRRSCSTEIDQSAKERSMSRCFSPFDLGTGWFSIAFGRSNELTMAQTVRRYHKRLATRSTRPVEAPDQRGGRRLRVVPHLLSSARKRQRQEGNIGRDVAGVAIFGSPEQSANANPIHGQRVFGATADEPSLIGICSGRENGPP